MSYNNIIEAKTQYNMQKLIFNPITFLGITILSVVFSISLYQSAQRTKLSTENLEYLEEEVSQMQAEVLSLETAIDQSQQPFAKEKIIRDELLMKKPNEYVIQIPDELVESITPIESKSIKRPLEEWQQLLSVKPELR